PVARPQDRHPKTSTVGDIRCWRQLLTPSTPYRITAPAASRRLDSMPLSVLQFPDFNPILVQFGPFAIRWYALAYITGILLGWIYGRRIIADESKWGGPAPLSVIDFDDFVLWVTLGIVLGGRTGYVLFYNLADYLAHPIAILQVW